ncbi:MAG: hypothetical protein ACI8RZ_001971 [Myxococcota bacterium]
MLLVLVWAALVMVAPAHAESPEEAALRAELERARREVADQVQLYAYDLIDELIYGWSQEPIFSSPTSVVLAGVTVPVGMGTGMQGLVENHIASGLIANPTSNIQLVHCPECTAVVVHSGPEGTIVSRGMDNPELLDRIGGATDRHALFVDIEAEGAWLVMRARLTRLTPDLPIVWSHTLSTSASTPSLLREQTALKSAADARAEYLDVLQSRGAIIVPMRVAVRSYARPDNGGIAPPPFFWIQTGVELGTTDARLWTSSILIGYSFIPQAYQGLMLQSRVSRLLTGRSRSLTRPDLYAFVGGGVINVWGPATAAFREEELTSDELLTNADGDDPRNSFGAFHLGLDLRVGNRIGLSTFLETMPILRNSPNLGEYTNVAGISFQSFGTEVTFWF